jgi:hypothetical protein
MLFMNKVLLLPVLVKDFIGMVHHHHAEDVYKGVSMKFLALVLALLVSTLAKVAVLLH